MKIELTQEEIEELLEVLEDTCFPIQIDWNKKDLYIKGLQAAFEIIKGKSNEIS